MPHKPDENPFNTRIPGRIHTIRERSVSMLNDGECFLVVPLTRVPKVALVEGTDVILFLTTKHGRFGILPSV